MNLKEAFRYQKFLDRLLSSAYSSIYNSAHCFKITKAHNLHKANPDADDRVEEVESTEPFFPNDDVIRFMTMIVSEKRKLSEAIGKAKRRSEFDIDAAIETNKFRQRTHDAIKAMLSRSVYKKTERAMDYKFNNDGVQAPYYYDVDIVATEAYDREESKKVMRSMIEEADAVSSQIDAALINIAVDYEPLYNVNESFEDIMAEFTSS